MRTAYRRAPEAARWDYPTKSNVFNSITSTIHKYSISMYSCQSKNYQNTKNFHSDSNLLSRSSSTCSIPSGRLIGLYCQVPAVNDEVACNAVGLRAIVERCLSFYQPPFTIITIGTATAATTPIPDKIHLSIVSSPLCFWISSSTALSRLS